MLVVPQYVMRVLSSASQTGEISSQSGSPQWCWCDSSGRELKERVFMNPVRTEFINAMRGHLEKAAWVTAAWLGGSDATDRTDELSDVDLQLIVPDGRVDDAFVFIESLLEDLGGIAHRWRVTEPIWHGHAQAVYKLVAFPESLCLDLLVMKRSSDGWLLERERHGDILRLVDREGILEQPFVDREALASRRQRLIRYHHDSQPIFQEVIAKAIFRGHLIEAGIRYHACVLKVLVELMRCEHCPDRFDFGYRYLDRDLPRCEQELLEGLAMPSSLEDLSRKFTQARNEINSRLQRLAGSEPVEH